MALIASQRSLVPTIVALTAGYSTLRHARRMLHEETGVGDGGGWTALIIAEVMIAFAAAAIALS